MYRTKKAVIRDIITFGEFFLHAVVDTCEKMFSNMLYLNPPLIYGSAEFFDLVLCNIYIGRPCYILLVLNLKGEIIPLQVCLMSEAPAFQHLSDKCIKRAVKKLGWFSICIDFCMFCIK